MKKPGQIFQFVLAMAFVFATDAALGQTNTWDGSSSANWNTAANWSLNQVPTASHDVIIPNGITATITVNTAAVCNTFTMNGGGTANTVSISAGNSLTVTNGISIGAGTGTGDNKTIAVGTGSLNCSAITVSATGNTNRNSGITLSTGTVTVSGSITMGDANDVFTFSGSGILYIGGSITGGTFTASTGTVNYNAAGSQTVAGFTYHNLTISGSGTKTLGGASAVGGTLTLSSGTFAVAGNSLTLNGPAIAGTPNNLSTTASSTLVFGGSSSGINVPSSVASLSNLTINNVNGISLSGPLSSGTLTFSSGILNTTATNLLTITNSGAGSIGGASATSYIVGPLARTLLANQTNYGTPYIFPVGDGASYRPLELLNLTSGVTTPVILVSESGTGAMNCDETTITSIGPRNWYLQVISGNFTSAYVRLTESGLDFTKTVGQSAVQSGNYVSVGGTNIGTSITSSSAITNATTPAYFGIGTTVVKTLYSYQSGDWNSTSTWTVDPSGSLWLGAAIPTAADNVVILNGRTIIVSQNGKNSLTLDIRLGGTLDLQTFNTHNFGTVSGQGTLKLSSGTFPGGIYTGFVAADGGTVEYYNYTGSLSTTQITYNNLLLTKSDNNATNYIMTLASNLSLNGGLTLNRTQGTGLLTFTVGNNATARTITISGNLTNNAGCWIGVGSFNAIHKINLYGDLTNNGTIRFTNRTLPWNNTWYNCGNLTTTGAADMFFLGATNNTVSCNGITDFHRLVVDKGTDQTYMLDIYSSNVSNFMLWAPNSYGPGATAAAACGVSNWSPVSIWKNLYVANGTIKLNSNITIPSLTEGGQDFNIVPTAQIWINGANVTTTINLNGTGYTATTLAGTLRITSGSFSTGASAGFVLGNGLTPTILVEGGTLDVSQIWTTGAGGTNISYTQTGGTVNVRGGGENHGGTFFELSRPECAFKMSGGTINFLNGQHSDNNWLTRIFDIRSDPGNIQITGGTININLKANTYDIISTAPLYDVNITRASGAANLLINLNNTVSPLLRVIHDLTINTNCELNSGTSNVNLNIAGNFNLNTGGIYSPNTNITGFNGSAGQVFTNAGTITTGLNNFVISNTSNTNITNNLTIRGYLTIDSTCFLNDQGSTISITGNVTNSGTHTSQANGSIILNGGGAQIIGGSGRGIFGNLTVNKTAGTSTFSANQSVTGNLRLVSGTLDINKYNLALSSNSNIYDVLSGTPAPTTFSNTKMIITSGQQSDGGLTKTFNAPGSFLYPVGTGAVYHPGTIAFSQAPATWGDVTVRPVPNAHPFIIAGNEVLTYYWKVSSNLITGIQPGSVSHTYKYVAADAGPSINTYVTGVYNPYSWLQGAVAQVDKINRNILFPSVSNIDGEYTAGIPAAFGTVKVYYSHRSGDWDTQSTWSNVSNNPASPDATTFPGPNDPVVIGDGGSNNHIVTISVNNKTVGGLQISTGSTLDIKATTGHNFGALPDLKIIGTGNLRVASGSFPRGDFGNFLGPNGGTIEYYTETAPSNIGAAFTLPVSFVSGVTTINITSYCNLILSPATGKNITLPNSNLTIFNDFNVNVSGTSVTGIAQFNNQNTTRTLIINGNLNINKGNLQYTNGNNTAQNVIVNGDVNVAGGAIFDVANALSATNTLYIQGDLTNNGTFDMIATATRICNVTFTGIDNKQIKGTTAIRTDFNILTVNKGIDRNSILEVTVNAFSLNTALTTALTISNGTFRLSTPLTITLTTSSPFTIPSSGSLSANIGTINIGAANNNAGDLLLQGRLEVMNTGVVNIGNGGGSNNDIEYAAAGNPELHISGGSLNVDGQIRRNTTNTLGSLWFYQSGGTITVKGNSFDNTRGMFEVLNSGSQFNISGGNLIVQRAGSVTYADVFITPENSTVNNSNGGHTLTIGNSSTPATQTFVLNISAPLWNLTIDGTTQNKTASLSINALSVLNNLTINGNGTAGTGSVFKANELDVTVSGSLTNNNLSAISGIDQGGYQAGAPGSTQTTTFTGTGNINGTGTNLTNFANLVIGSTSTNPSVTLGSSSNIWVNSNLTLVSGTLSDAGNTITVLGDIDNSAIHSSPLTPGGGIILSSGNKQIISGSGGGRFGNLTINNASGVSMVDDSRITGQLSLSGGLLYIDDYKLIMDVNSSFSGPFDSKHMIELNGVLSDEGVQKYFSGSSSGFVFPIGSSGKYRPATFTFTSSNAGSIKIVPIALAHPADNVPANDQLNYYWKITTSGFSGLTSSTQIYQYGASEVTGNESNYHGALYNNYIWSDYGTSVINSTAHTITISRPDLLPGEYTAGEVANFIMIHKLYSIKSGNWNDGTVWAEDLPTNPACGYYPNGNPVFIQQGHTIVMNINNAYAYTVNIEGTLDLGISSFHNLGYIIDTLHAGTGKMMLQATTGGMFLFPGGNYDAYMMSPGTTVELYGTTNAALPLKPGNIYKPYQNLTLTGSGIKYMSAEDVKILGNLTINNGAKLNNSLFNQNLYIHGNWTDLNSASSGFIPGTGLVSFQGNVAQTLIISNAITENFYDLEINNPAGLTITGGGKAQVSDILTLNSGTITTSATNSLTITNASTSAIEGGSVTSFVNGPLRKQISNGSYFAFPVGKTGTPSRFGNVYLSNIVNAGIWEAEYYNALPVYDITKKKLPISHVSNNEYWMINGVAGGSGSVQLRWDANSGYAGSSLATRSKIRIVEWNPAGVPVAQWEYRGKILNDGGDSYGTVATDNIISLSPGANMHYLTIGDEGLPTATITSPLTASICNDAVASTTVTVALTGTPPWSLTYRLGSVTTTLNNIATSPVSIVLTSASPGIVQPIATPTLFNFNITNVNDLTGTPGTTDYVTTVGLTVNPVPVNTITGKTLVGTGEVVGYSTPSDAITYVWSLPSGGTLTNGNTASPTVTWGAVVGSFTLSMTKTGANGCVTTNNVVVTTSTTPTPVITGNQYVCAGSTGQVYSTPNVAGHDYTWTITPGTAGTITSGGNTNSCTITWNGVATGNSVNVREHVTSSGSPGIFTNATLPVDIGIQPSASIPVYSAPGAVCFGSTAAITINNSENGVRYQIRLNSNNSNVGAAVNGNGGSIVLSTTAITSSTIYNIYAFTLPPYNCGIQLNNPALTFTVNIADNVWTGAIGTNWNVAGNWSCGLIPGPATIVQIPDVSNKPVLSSGAVATVNNLTIAIGSSLTISGNTIQIGGTITNNGTFTATNGTVELNGSAAQVIGAGLFAGNTIKDLIINNNAGVTLQGPLNITGIVTVSSGSLSSAGNLTLISTAAGTALISGSGTGAVTGNVTMQRYLSSGFGYKYFSSPFQAATVGEFGDDMDLNATFTTFYSFDENRYISGFPTSGWVRYNLAANILNPLSGYAVNFGSSGVPNTVDVTGIVNNGALSVPLYNHNQINTTGFNLVGNPYPSPIDWNLVKVNNTNVDDAIYFFNATDEYDGTYSSYVNGVPSNGATSIIPSMQGFFVHITPLFPVAGTLVMNNSVRINDLTSPFAKSAYKGAVPLLRLSASFSDDTASFDPVVVYFDDKATTDFDSQLDALKLINTDTEIPNLYAVSSDGSDLSISALPNNSETSFTVPLGLNTYKDGVIIFKVRNLSLDFPGVKIYFSDVSTGTQMEIMQGKEYKVSLPAEAYKNRFFINFSNITTDANDINTGSTDPFIVYCSDGILKAEINEIQGKEGILLITNITGQLLFTDKVFEKGQYDFNPSLKDGIYIVSYVTGKIKISKKIIFLNR